MGLDESFYDEKATAQEALDDGQIDFGEYQDWIAEIEEEQATYFEEEW